MSQTTISVSVAFDRIWALAVSMEHGTGWKDTFSFMALYKFVFNFNFTLTGVIT